MHLFSCTNTHHDVTDFVDPGMVKYKNLNILRTKDNFYEIKKFLTCTSADTF